MYNYGAESTALSLYFRLFKVRLLYESPITILQLKWPRRSSYMGWRSYIRSVGYNLCKWINIWVIKRSLCRPHVYKKMPSQGFSVSANFTSASQNSHRLRVAPCFDKLFMQPMLACRLHPVYDHAVTRVLQKLHARSSWTGFHQRIRRERSRCSAVSVIAAAPVSEHGVMNSDSCSYAQHC